MGLIRWVGRILQRAITFTLVSAAIGAVFFALDKAFLSDAERPPKDDRGA